MQATYNLAHLPDHLQDQIIAEPMTGCWLFVGHGRLLGN